ncbi:MAG: bifunctional riboflavin kinase/FAD synthetase [Bacteroidota bacterium]
MKIIYSQNETINLESSILTIGTFDGVHYAHQSLIKETVERAKLFNTKSVIVTFHPHPKHIVSTNLSLELLTNINEKISFFEKLNVDYLYIVNFTQEFSKLSYQDFVSDYIVKNFHPIEIIVGYNYGFGKDRSAGTNELEILGKQFSFNVKISNQIKIDDSPISSTYVRKLLSNGNIEDANKILNYNYNFTGEVIRGDGRGRQLGFPTANLKIDEPLKIIPQNGIYVVGVELNKEYFHGLMNVGVIPTFFEKHDRRVEVYILDFSKDIYGENLTVEVLHRLRDELKFLSVEELIVAMKQDEINGREWLKTNKIRSNTDVNERA